MNLESIKNLSLSKGKALMRELQRVLDGKDIEDRFYDGDTDLNFPKLVAAVKSADDLAAKSLNDYRKRSELRYAMAVLRDARYSSAGRRHHLSLGLHNTLRESYERGRIALNSGDTA
jgi:hypothetical protein